MTVSTDHHVTEQVSVPGTLEDRVFAVLRRTSVPALRVALGLVFVWFGALKVTGDSPAGDLVAGVLPWLPADPLVVGLGGFEVLLGLVVIAGYRVTLAMAVMVAHLLGTFLVFVSMPEVAYLGDNPMLVTIEGEFVAKNLVLIAAALVVAAYSRSDRRG